MGCDIHVFYEIKINDCWEYYSAASWVRNYDLFEIMAGVRGKEENCKFPVKGFPENAGTMTKLHYERWGVDAHTPSYIEAHDLIKLFNFMELTGIDFKGYENTHRYGGYLFGNGFECFYKYRDDYPDFVQDIRIVFWFDN